MNDTETMYDFSNLRHLAIRSALMRCNSATIQALVDTCIPERPTVENLTSARFADYLCHVEELSKAICYPADHLPGTELQPLVDALDSHREAIRDIPGAEGLLRAMDGDPAAICDGILDSLDIYHTEETARDMIGTWIKEYRDRFSASQIRDIRFTADDFAKEFPGMAAWLDGEGLIEREQSYVITGTFDSNGKYYNTQLAPAMYHADNAARYKWSGTEDPILIRRADGSVAAARAWRGCAIDPETEDASECISCGDNGHYAPWTTNPDELAIYDSHDDD